MLPDWPPFMEIETDTIVSEAYQRPLDEKRVLKMVNGFNIRIFGALTVADVTVDTNAGQYAIIDGQHRLEVAVRKSMETVWVQLHENLTYQQRAQMFVDIQTTRKGLSPVQRFKGEVEAGVGRAVDLNRMVEEAGLHVSDIPATQDAYGVRAIVGLERIYNRRRDIVPRVLYVCNSWPSVSQNRTSNYIIRGLGMFLLRNPEVDHQKLAGALEEQEASPNSLLDVAQQIKSVGGGDAMTRGVERALEAVWRRASEGGRGATAPAAAEAATA